MHEEPLTVGEVQRRLEAARYIRWTVHHDPAAWTIEAWAAKGEEEIAYISTEGDTLEVAILAALEALERGQ